ncbi:MAG TPA: TetR/AcrR family transcriptional regulator [Solirubrobacteraceae bacterium]|nr:TetR/AcrR family transcriptional regulator [Solirubrobacteraceae bacterium]
MAVTTTEGDRRASIFAPTIPGLPSGYTGLPRELVEASQRQRLLHGVTVAIAEKGYGPTTIVDITARAGVSKKTFYEHFPDKLACFLAAHDVGSRAMLDAVTDASRRALHDGADPVEQLRRANGAYLTFLIQEEPYARTFFLETLAAGPAAIARYRHCREGFVSSLRAWHGHARRQRPEWPPATDFAYEAAMGAAHELALARIATGRTAELASLEDELLEIQLAILRVPAGT